MEAATQDMSAIIADEIAEYNQGSPSSRISPEVRTARFEGLVQLVQTVLAALEQAEMGAQATPQSTEDEPRLKFDFFPRPFPEFILAVLVEGDRLSYYREARRGKGSSPLDVTAELFWDPLHRRWVGPRLGRDHNKVGAPWVRESAEAVLTRAILTAYNLVAGKER
ncbi:hypothetical protein L6R46_31050 [Myxococcota bacterium]|nr:hypothetical protein [Myxococcota bacterium]